MFTTYLVQRNVRDQETLVDHMTNPAEKRLARALLLLANHFDGSEPLLIAAPFSQGHTGQHDRHNSPARQFVHEQIQKT